jgi:hypothetical protein
MVNKFFILIFEILLLIGLASSASIYTDLNMQNNSIFNVTNINATIYYGNGSNLIGVNTSFNQALTDSLYSGIEWDYNQTIPANNYSDALNISQANWVDSLFVRFTEIVSQVGNWTLDKPNYIPYTGATSNVDLGTNNFTVDTNTLFVDSTNNRVGIGTTSPVSKLSFGATGTTGTASKQIAVNEGTDGKFFYGLGIAGSEGSEGLGLWGGTENDLPSATNAHLFIKRNTGNIGIGTTAPQQKLHVNGSAIINGTINMDSNKITNLANGTATQDAVAYSQLTDYYLKSNPYTFWNSTFSTFNKTYADTIYSPISEPLSLHLNQDNWFNSSDGYIYFNGTNMEFNSSKLATIYYNASTIQIITGIPSGTISGIKNRNDGVTYNATESSGDLEIRVNFTDIEEFNNIIIRYRSDEGAIIQHIISIQFWDYNASMWESHGVLTDTGDFFNTLEFGVEDVDEHISNGLIQMRLYQAEGGVATHLHELDWIVLAKGLSSTIPNEVDPVWSSDKPNYLLITQWNATNESYYLKDNPFGFYNSTNPSPVINASYYLATNPFGFYNSTTAPTYLNDTFRGTNYSTFLTHITWANAINGTLAKTSDLASYVTTTVFNSIGNWTLDKVNYYTKEEVTTNISTAIATVDECSEISGCVVGAITDLVSDTTPQLGGYLDTNGNNIGSTSDEIENVYVATNSRIYFGDGQETNIYYNGTSLIISG